MMKVCLRDLNESADVIKGMIPPLTRNLHKGQCGRMAVIGGCEEYTGAPYFAAISSLYLGADVAHVFCSPEASVAIKCYSPEIAVHPMMPSLSTSLANEDAEIARCIQYVASWFSRLSVLVIGPGLGQNPRMLRAAMGILERARAAGLPIVVDADGLAVVNDRPDIIRGYKWAVLTPNLNEFGRLCSNVIGVKVQLPKSNPFHIDPNASESGLGIPGRVVRHSSTLNALGQLLQEDFGSAQGVDIVSHSTDLAQRVSQNLGGVTILRKYDTDVITDGEVMHLNAASGSVRRCGGQGDITCGVIGTFLSWAHTLYKARRAFLQAPSSSIPIRLPGVVWARSSVAMESASDTLSVPRTGSPVLLAMDASDGPPTTGAGDRDNSPSQHHQPVTSHDPDLNDHLPTLAALAGSMVTRECARMAFQRHRRGTTTTTMIACLGEVFAQLFDEAP